MDELNCITLLEKASSNGKEGSSTDATDGHRVDESAAGSVGGAGGRSAVGTGSSCVRGAAAWGGRGGVGRAERLDFEAIRSEVDLLE